ncbi:aromatic ring-hydroxylating oxygenase subunit alpha [Oricola indica]|uniref:aromatic ring-hydroxylating oxygenase subunit alpha n=1 Tax=Oricola indica TaxID=2872591 RepID=UPI003CCBDC77
MNVTRKIEAAIPSYLSGMKEDLEQGLVPMRIFNDPDVHRLEMQGIFTRSWIFIAHESEIPNVGDFVARSIGEDPYVCVRDENGDIRVLLNSCRHRGAHFCRVDMGNAKTFTCPYHGWSYKTTGELDGVPAPRQGYRGLKLEEWGLFQAPHVENYKGLIFANLDTDAVPFLDYVGDYKWYLDIQFGLTAGGMEVLGEPHRWVVDANWKQGSENFCGDSSHTQTTHRSVLEAGLAHSSAAGAPGKLYGLHISCNGYALSVRQDPDNTIYWNYPEEVYKLFGSGELNESQLEMARTAMVHNGTLFPNFSFLHFGVTDTQERAPSGFLTMRVWQPRGPGKTEIWNWILAPKEASEEYKRRAYQVGMSSFSPSGSFEQDDVALWPGVARSASMTYAQVNNVKANYQMGLGPMSDVEPLKDWSGPGVAVPSNAGESGLRTFYNTWIDRLTSASGTSSK